MNSLLTLFATAPKGVASLLVEELTGLGATDAREQPAGVIFRGSLETAYRACLWSRCASRILLQLGRFPAASPEQLYQGIREIDWSEHLAPDGSLAVDFNTSRSAITHSHYGALKVKDAIVDQFRERAGVRPGVDTRHPDLRINVHLHRDEAVVSLDLSGDSLHRRGYRKQPVEAPLKENLAAALLIRAGWPEVAERGGALLDPMCGSGTLPIEAALMAADAAPGLQRERFGFTGWKRHDSALWERLLNEARERRESGMKRLPRIVGYDTERSAVRAAIANVEAAGLHGLIHIERGDLSALQPPESAEPGLVIVNPPYGERLGEVEALTELYGSLADRLKQGFVGWQAAVFTGNPELTRRMGLRARKQYAFYNGAIPCKLLCFELQPAWFVERPVISGGVVMPRPATPEQLGEGAQMFANRLRKNLRELGRWARREGITCYRLYDADMPEYALAIDLYYGQQLAVHVQEYQAPRSIDPDKARTRLREALAVLPGLLDVPMERIHFKVRSRQKGKEQYRRQAEENNFFEVEEGGCRFLVNLTDYLDTGLFLDHRLTRALIGELAPGRRMLNLFAYTGSATVYAAKGGARATTSVDMSRTYLDWTRRNMALNGFSGGDHTFVRADCLDWLERQTGVPGQRYDLIFLDPPTFSTSKRMGRAFDVQRNHVKLIRDTARLLTADGVLIFSNNFRRFRLDRASLGGLNVEEITRLTLPRDFARNTRIHHCWRITIDPTHA